MGTEIWLSVGEVAERLRVHVETVRRWLRSGELRGAQLGGKSGYRITEDDLEAFMDQKYNRPRIE